MVRTFHNIILETRNKFYCFFRRVLEDNNNEVNLQGKTCNLIIDGDVTEIVLTKVDLDGDFIFVTYTSNGEENVTELTLLTLDEIVKIGELIIEEFNYSL